MDGGGWGVGMGVRSGNGSEDRWIGIARSFSLSVLQ